MDAPCPLPPSLIWIADTEYASSQKPWLLTTACVSANCPDCQNSSSRIHGYYCRTLADLPNGDQSIEVVKENPYRLAQDIWGVGFRTADKIAQQLGVDLDSVRRLEAGLVYTLSEGTEFGHMYLPQPKLLKAAEILTVEPGILLPILEGMATAQTVIAEDIQGEEPSAPVVRAFYHPALYYTEIGLAAPLSNSSATPAHSAQ